MKMPYKSLMVLGLVISSPYISLAVHKATGKESENKPSIINFVEDAKIKNPQSVKDKVNQAMLRDSKAPSKLQSVNEGQASYKQKILDRLNLIED